MVKRNFIFIVVIIIFLVSCRKKDDFIDTPMVYGTPYNLQLPPNFAQMPIPVDNPLTVEGVELGRYLFYEKKLSGNNTMSCASCHSPSKAFSDTTATSKGIDGIAGNRNSMPLFNLGWSNTFFWDGRAATLEEQVLKPVEDPIEMHETWSNAMDELRAEAQYNTMFKNAFGVDSYDSTHAAKALAQFLRTLISGNSKYDKARRGELTLNPLEQEGFNIFQNERGQCFHCHSPQIDLFSDFSFKNNGLNANHTDLGRAAFTNQASDEGLFKSPSLRNLVFTAPYMHDGSIETLDSVLNFYRRGVNMGSPNISPEMLHGGGVQLNDIEIIQLKAFLLTLTDSSFVQNPAFQDPH